MAHQAPLSIGFSRQRYWVALSCSRGSSWPRGRTRVSCIAGRFFIVWTTKEALESHDSNRNFRSGKQKISLLTSDGESCGTRQSLTMIHLLPTLSVPRPAHISLVVTLEASLPLSYKIWCIFIIKKDQSTEGDALKTVFMYIFFLFFFSLKQNHSVHTIL